MKILGLDCATSTGWALMQNNKLIESGVQSFKKKRGESNGMLFLRYRKWLKDLIVVTSPDLVAYEQAHHRGGAATELCVGLTTRVQEIATEYNIEYTSIHTATVKKTATGKGNAKKPEMIKAFTEKFNKIPDSDDEADAAFVALAAQLEVG